MSVAILNTDAGVTGKTLVIAESIQTISGAKTFSLAPAAPFAVQAGSAVVANLDADKLDGLDSLAFLLIAGGTLTGDLKFTDASFDIGKSGATRPRDGFFSRNVVIGGTLAVTGAVTFTVPPSALAQSIVTVNPGAITAGVTTYCGFGGVAAYSATETDVKFPCPVAGTVKALYATADGSPGGSETFVYTVRKNGVDQTLTCTTSAAGLTSNDTTHSFTVAAGDVLSMKIVTSGGASTRKHMASYLLVTT